MSFARIRLTTLTELCYRVGTSLKAGVDLRRTWDRETERARGTDQRVLQAIGKLLASGESLSDAVERTGDYFPLTFRRMVRVGDATGGLDHVLLRLADRFRLALTNRRGLFRALQWPLTELGITVLIVGFLIYLPEWLPKSEGQMTDILGLGLVGVRGLVWYGFFLLVATLVGGLFLVGIRDDRFGARHVVAFLELLPGIGSPIRDLALGRVAWSLGLTTNTPMNLKESLELATEAALLPRLVRTQTSIQRDLGLGKTLTDSLTNTGQYPAEFLDAIEVGEQTGMLSESVERLSKVYEERAQFAIQRLAMFAGMLLWVLVAIVIICLVVNMYSGYVGMLNELT